MKIKRFTQLLKNNNAIRLDDEYILFSEQRITNLELYSFDTEESVYFDDIKSLLSYPFKGKTMKEFIEDTEDFYRRFDGGRGASSTQMGGGFNHAPGGGREVDLNKMKFPSEFNVGGKKRH